MSLAKESANDAARELDRDGSLDAVSTVGLVNLPVERTELIVRQEIALARAESADKAERALVATSAPRPRLGT